MMYYRPSEEMKKRLSVLLEKGMIDYRMQQYLLHWQYTEKDFLRVVDAAERWHALEVLREYNYLTKEEDDDEGKNYTNFEESDATAYTPKIVNRIFVSNRENRFVSIAKKLGEAQLWNYRWIDIFRIAQKIGSEAEESPESDLEEELAETIIEFFSFDFHEIINKFERILSDFEMYSDAIKHSQLILDGLVSD